MAHKTFISYKYRDVVEDKEYYNLRDRIIRKLGDDAKFYRGENSSSPYLGDLQTETIKRKLSDMIYDTSVMIVILSPNMKQSDWMEWEIKYALRNQPRNDRKSHPNGIVAVVQKQETYGFMSDGYAWFKNYLGNWDLSKTFSVIQSNRNNKKSMAPNYLSNNYIDIVTEDTFMLDPSRYIEDAYSKSQNIDYYN